MAPSELKSTGGPPFAMRLLCYTNVIYPPLAYTHACLARSHSTARTCSFPHASSAAAAALAWKPIATMARTACSSARVPAAAAAGAGPTTGLARRLGGAASPPGAGGGALMKLRMLCFWSGGFAFLGRPPPPPAAVAPPYDGHCLAGRSLGPGSEWQACSNRDWQPCCSQLLAARSPQAPRRRAARSRQAPRWGAPHTG